MPNDGDKAQPGWYTDKRWPDEQRRWDGARWLDDWRPVMKTSPEALMVVGLLLTILGGVLTAVGFAITEAAGWIVAGAAGLIAGTVFNVGVIAKAVDIGIRASRR